MRTHSRFFRLTATTAIVGLTLGPALPQTARAQSAPPPLAPPAAAPVPAPQTTADPPTRVGRLSRLVGQVSFHDVGATQWDAANLNFPVTSGDSFWTQPAASADIGVTNNRITMDQSTDLDITALDDQTVGATLPQGQVYLRLRALAPGETYTVLTPRGSIAITSPGQYEITAGDTQDPTRITVVTGAAQISGSNLNLQASAGQTVLITGTDPFETQVVAAQRDAFLTAQLAREQPAAPSGGITAPAEVAQMTGGDDLYDYGTWAQTPDYGTVWYPQVAAGYVPYRNGHWAYVAPWGWTWIDAAPWGFAPFHYGRWVEIGGRWGWAPGGGAVAYGAPGYVAPVYAPALVTFFGIGVGVAIGAALASGFHGNVGWCPLGWQEPYRPWYRTSPAYLRNVNVGYVRNVANFTRIDNTNVTINNFANRRGATMVPASAMALSRPINQVAHPIPPGQFANAHAVVGRQPLDPTTATAGVNARVAQEMHLQAPPAGTGAVANRRAPGPAIRAQAVTPNARPQLEQNGRPAPASTVRPGQPAGERPAGPRTQGAPGGEPALRTPAEIARPGAPPVRSEAGEAHPGAAGRPTVQGAPRPEARPGNPAAEAHPGAVARPGAEPRPAVEPRAQVHEQAAPQRAPEQPHPVEARPEARSSPPSQAHPTPRPQARPEPRPAPRPEARPEPRPQPRPEPHAEPRPAARPAPHPAGRPEERHE